MKKSIIKGAALAAVVVGLVTALAGCTSAAQVASTNLSTQADNFQIQRQVVFYNSITGQYIEEIIGLCSVTNGATQVAVTCEVGKNRFTKDFMGKSDNVMWFAHQTTPANVSSYQYQIILRPSTIIPSFSTSTPKDLTLITPNAETTPQPSPAPTK